MRIYIRYAALLASTALLFLLATAAYAQPTISINADNVMVMEGDSGTRNMTFTVDLTVMPGDEEPMFTVNVRTLDFSGSATPGADYTPIPMGTLLTFPGNMSSSMEVNVPIIGDTEVEGDENLIVLLENPSGAAVLGNIAGMGTILDDDSQARLSIDDVMMAEGQSGTTTFIFTVSLTNANTTGDPVSVDFVIDDGTATAGEDYQDNASTFMFDTSSTDQERFIAVAVNGDTIHEPDETFFVRISSPNNGVIVIDDRGRGTINNDDAVPLISVDDVSVMEGNSGTEDATFTVSLSNANAATVQVNYDTSPDSASSPSDFLAASDTVTFLPGEVQKTFSVSINGDTIPEPNETFNVTLSNPMNGVLDGNGTVGVGTILNDDGAPLPTVSVSDVSVLENAGPANFAISLSEPAPGPITVQATTVDGSAMAGDNDFVPRDNIQVAFAQGEQIQSFPVTVIDDNNVEPDETFTVTLSNPMGANITDGEAVGTIRNDDAGALPEISIGDTALFEGDSGQQMAAVVLTLSATSTQLVTVDYTTEDGTATAGDDYQQADTQASFDAGSVMTTVMVPIFGDTEAEPDETFFVDLSNPGNATLAADTRGRVTIRNDDVVVPTLSIDDVTVIEGDAGTIDAVFTVTLSEPSGGGTVMVDFTTVDDTATAADGDFTAQMGTLTFTGDGLTQTITVPVFGDTVDEGHELFLVQLANPVNATIDDGEGEGRIRNDDSTGPLSFSVSDVQVAEGNAPNTTQAIFQISLSSTADTTVTVAYATADGTATTADGDYQTKSGTASFAPGETLVEVPVLVTGDDNIEADETFTMVLSAPQGAVIADGTGVATITNDDDVALPTLTINDIALNEGDAGTTTAALNVSLSAASASPVRVSFATEDGTAQAADGDYTPASGEIVFAAGQTAQTIAVDVIGDDRVEPQEVFTVNLSAPTGATLDDAAGTVTILNDDAPPVPRISIGNASATEGDSGQVEAVFVVSLDIPAPGPVSVNFATVNGTAGAAAGDYVATTGQLTIAAGQSNGAVRVPINGDTLIEGDETFTVLLSAPVGGILADDRGTGTIVDDDTPVVLSEIRLVRAPATVEGAGPAMVTLERIGNASGAAEVVLNPADGTASAGQDYRASDTPVRWADGELGEKTVSITLVDDRRREQDETIIFRLSQPQNATLSPPDQLELVILDDDTPMKLEVVGEAERTIKVDEQLALAVTASRDDGTIIEGATVAWALEGRGQLVDTNPTVTDDQGQATNTVRFGSRPGETVVTATLVGMDVSARFTITVEGDLGGMIDPEEEPEDAAVADVLDDSCANADGEFDELCDYVFELDDEDDQMEVIDEIVPMEVSAQAGVSLETPQVQLRNIGARLSALRGGAARQGLDQLALDIRGEGVSIGGVRTAVQGYRGSEAELVAAQLHRALARGGAASADEQEAAVIEDPNDQRLGFFVNGRLSIGDRPSTIREAGYDFESRGLTAGIDYRVTHRFILGGALGYMDTETEIDRDGGRLDADGYTLAAYGTYYLKSFYLEGVLSYGENSYELVRNIDLPQAFQGRNRFTARGAPDGSQTALSLGAGYDGALGAVTLGGFGRVSYVDGEIDAYTESGASAFNLRIDAQELESLLSEVGFEVGYAASFNWGVLLPTLRASYLHEFEDDGRLIRSRFAADLQANEFLIATDAPDRDFFNLGIGLTFTLKKGRAFYFLYDTDLQRADLDIYTISAGARLQF